ncbi:MAG TPA: hypothetical protein VIJ39_07430 [Solirubrobacteraceae bacterium]
MCVSRTEHYCWQTLVPSRTTHELDTTTANLLKEIERAAGRLELTEDNGAERLRTSKRASVFRGVGLYSAKAVGSQLLDELTPDVCVGLDE